MRYQMNGQRSKGFHVEVHNVDNPFSFAVVFSGSSMQLVKSSIYKEPFLVPSSWSKIFDNLKFRNENFYRENHKCLSDDYIAEYFYTCFVALQSVGWRN
jgi:hypothetical protein